MKAVLVMFKRDERREFPITEETTTIGRSPESDLRIPTPDVSRRHCELVIEGDKLIVHDVGSSNGTYVNGRSIEETVLKPGDRLTIGPVTFTVQIDGEPAEIRPSDSWVSGAGLHAEIAAGEKDEPPTQIVSDDENEDTGDLIDLDALDLEEEDPFNAVEAMLDDDEDEDEKN